MKISDKIDAVVAKAVKDLSGCIPNADIAKIVKSEWPPHLVRVEPTPGRIGRSMVRLGYEKWKLGGIRGFYC